jgi:hypothetical protein
LDVPEVATLPTMGAIVERVTAVVAAAAATPPPPSPTTG